MKISLASPPRTLTVLLSTLAAAAVTASAALVSPVRPVTADPAKPDITQVKALYAEKCSACHNLPSPEEKGYNRMEWQRTVNTMLTKYHASDEISAPQAAQIVDYLATFAPKPQAGGNGRQRGDLWATDGLDVWTGSPSASHVYNFEAGGLAGFSPLGSGTPGPAPLCAVRPDALSADGSVLHLSGPSFRADRFAVLLDRADAGRSMDVRVRFRIDSGKVSPAAGIVFAYAAPNQYTVLRCDQALGTLALIQIAGSAHTTLQQTPIALPASLPAAPVAPSPLAPGWHTLRLLVHDGQVRGWIDMQKRISVTLPANTGGKVGLWTQGNTSASFDDWIVDCYDAPVKSAAPVS